MMFFLRSIGGCSIPQDETCQISTPSDRKSNTCAPKWGGQRKEILQLQRAGISTASAELLLGRMHAKIDDLCAERDRLKKEQPAERRVIGGRSW